jgi:hypothetical protein
MSTRRRPLALALTLTLALAMAAPLLLAGACRSGGEASTRVDLQDPAQLGTFAAHVEQEPDRADELLADAGIRREELFQAILDVARDPEAARKYRDAFEAELGTAGEA